MARRVTRASMEAATEEVCPFDAETLARAEEVATAVVDAAVHVHSRLGPGLLEKTYELCLAHALMARGFKVETQLGVPLTFDDLHIGTAFRLDMLVESLVIVELKT